MKLKIFALSLLVVVMSVAMVGCSPSLPKGYSDTRGGNLPIIYDNGDFSFPSFDIRVQFPELNGDEAHWHPYEGKRFFRYDGKIYYLGGSFSWSRTWGEWDNPYVFRLDEDILIGYLSHIIDEKADINSISICFVHENSVYYNSVAGRTFHNGFPIGDPKPITFSKFAYFRFCLESGTNESVNIYEFVDILNKVSPKQYKVNPNFKTK